jgi:hypothetical protein
MEQARQRGEVKEVVGCRVTVPEQDLAATVYVPVAAKRYRISQGYHVIR